MFRIKAALVAIAMAVAAPAMADFDPNDPYDRGLFATSMLSWIQPDNLRDLDDGFGGILGLGYRDSPAFAAEIVGEFSKLDRDRQGLDESSDLVGGNVTILLSPFAGNRNFFLPISVGYLDAESQGVLGQSYDGISYSGGVGYLIPIKWGDYKFALRAEARVRVSDDEDEEDGGELAGETMTDYVYNLGLHLPFGSAPPPPPPAPPPAPPAPAPKAACSDGLDNDGDALVDFPDDPGCTGADDQDESNPKQCADGKDNDGDGMIDFPDDKGCDSADDDSEEKPCKKPLPGQRISLKGCGVGEILVLRGLGFTFDFDKADLSQRARTTLDNVTEELNTYPNIKIELSGHTDSKGSDAYNQRLSERRAKSVKRYLLDKGIAGSRMSTVGFGETQPVADNEIDEGRALNRRVELMVTEGESDLPDH